MSSEKALPKSADSIRLLAAALWQPKRAKSERDFGYQPVVSPEQAFEDTLSRLRQAVYSKKRSQLIAGTSNLWNKIAMIDQ